MKTRDDRPTAETMRFDRLGYEASIVVSDSHQGPIYHYVVSRKGSQEIIGFGQAPTLQDAIAAVNEDIDHCAARRQSA